jgi:hypothetical protein
MSTRRPVEARNTFCRNRRGFWTPGQGRERIGSGRAANMPKLTPTWTRISRGPSTVQMSGARLVANTWSCYLVDIDLDTGRILCTSFTK